MKDIKIILPVLALVIMTLAGCKKEKEYKTFGQPNWQEVFNTEYTSSMTAVVDLPRELSVYEQDTDELAAFVNGECRGVAKNVDGHKYIMIKCMPDENGMVTFRYYSSANKYMYECANCTPLENDGIYGTADSPVILKLKVINE